LHKMLHKMTPPRFVCLILFTGSFQVRRALVLSTPATLGQRRCRRQVLRRTCAAPAKGSLVRTPTLCDWIRGLKAPWPALPQVDAQTGFQGLNGLPPQSPPPGGGEGVDGMMTDVLATVHKQLGKQGVKASERTKMLEGYLGVQHAELAEGLISHQLDDQNQQQQQAPQAPPLSTVMMSTPNEAVQGLSNSTPPPQRARKRPAGSGRAPPGPSPAAALRQPHLLTTQLARVSAVSSDCCLSGEISLSAGGGQSTLLHILECWLRRTWCVLMSKSLCRWFSTGTLSLRAHLLFVLLLTDSLEFATTGELQPSWRGAWLPLSGETSACSPTSAWSP